MLFKYHLRLICFWAACALGNACALLPDLKNDGMSDKEKAELNLQMGVRYMELNMLEVAKEKLDAAYALNSRDPEVLNALAIYYERVKNDEEAANYYQAALNKVTDGYSIKNNYGRFLCDHGEHEKGLDLLQEALDSPFNKQSWLTLSNMGICYAQRHNSTDAEQFFRRALEVNPHYPLALKEMARISYHNQQFMSARAFLQRYAAVAKDTAETLWIGFQTERALGNQQGAEEYKEKLLISFPTSNEALQVKSAISK